MITICSNYSIVFVTICLTRWKGLVMNSLWYLLCIEILIIDDCINSNICQTQNVRNWKSGKFKITELTCIIKRGQTGQRIWSTKHATLSIGILWVCHLDTKETEHTQQNSLSVLNQVLIGDNKQVARLILEGLRPMQVHLSPIESHTLNKGWPLLAAELLGWCMAKLTITLSEIHLY